MFWAIRPEGTALDQFLSLCVVPFRGPLRRTRRTLATCGVVGVTRPSGPVSKGVLRLGWLGLSGRRFMTPFYPRVGLQGQNSGLQASVMASEHALGIIPRNPYSSLAAARSHRC